MVDDHEYAHYMTTLINGHREACWLGVASLITRLQRAEVVRVNHTHLKTELSPLQDSIVK